jgi:Co/Zn/Cd efflux system component
MFLAEVAAGFVAGSVSLQADALDFLGDAFNYGISLAVVGLALSWRARAALFKGITMTLFGLWVIGTTAWHIAYGVVPEPYVMGAIGTLALAANGAVALMLYRFRDGDSNMRSVWVCSRNDVLGNIAVLFAALGVFGTGTMWPDIIVAAAMAGLALQGSATVVRHSLSELRLASA